MGGNTARALLGAALVVVTLAVAAGELAAGPAGASREHANEAQLEKPHERRPAAANRPSPAQTPMALAVDAAQKQNAVTTALRDSIARYVTARQQADAEIAAQQAAAEAEAVAAAARRRSPRRGASSGGGAAPSGPGGTLACIRAHESDRAGGYSAVNSSSGAGGAYQALPSTWDGYGGFARAEQAPPALQDQWASEALAASGTRPWAGSGC